ncbi:MAG: tetratricopeptide repeat protein, partial [Gammaproteobacteria bacterium]|nr:tetratricopeptide repeat protein [Gammaproteobacteria bacterium]
TNLGTIAYYQGDYATARNYNQQGLVIKQALGDQRGITINLNNLGVIAHHQGNYAAVHDYYQQSLAIRQAIGDQRGIAMILNNLGFVAYSQEDYAAALDYYQQSLAIKHALGDQWGIANSLINLGFVHFHLHPEQARPSLHQALAIAQDIQAPRLILEAVVGFAWLYMNKARPTRASKLAGLAQHHPAHNTGVQLRLDELLPQLEEALPPIELQAALARGKTLDLGTVVAELLEEFAEDHA